MQVDINISFVQLLIRKNKQSFLLETKKGTDENQIWVDISIEFNYGREDYFYFCVATIDFWMQRKKVLWANTPEDKRH